MSAAAVPVLATKLPSAGTLAVLAAIAVVAIAVLSYVMRRHAHALPLLAVFALPFRVPISTQGRTVNLLVPLYLVIAAGVLVHLLPRLARGELWPRRRQERASMRSLAFWGSTEGLRLVLLIAVALYALQGSYSSDHTKAAENLAFFYVPFGLLFVLLSGVDWTRELLLRCLALLVALAVLFAGVGFVEYDRKSLLLNPKVVAANEYDNYFRVNSVFFDPSIYGRFLALVMIAITTAVLWSVRRRHVLVGAALLAWLLAGLVTSFSQSSIAALLLACAILAAWRWSVSATLYASCALAVLALAVLLAAPASLHFGLKGSGGSANNATSGRANLVEGGLKLFAKRPLEGYGSGSFETQYRRNNTRSAGSNAVSASHTIPVTIAAEQGIVGLAVYLALIASALSVLFRGAGRSPPRIALAACFAALVLHTWAYADFLEDPFTWTLLAIGVALAARDAPAPAPAPALAPAAGSTPSAGLAAAGQ